MNTVHTCYCYDRAVMSAAMSDEEKIQKRLHNIYRKCQEGNNGCLIFTGASSRDGYGKCHLRYPGAGEIHTSSHRAVYILENRQPDLLRDRTREVSHTCGEKKCVRLQHLFLESPSENEFRKSCHRDGQCYHCEPPCSI